MLQLKRFKRHVYVILSFLLLYLVIARISGDNYKQLESKSYKLALIEESIKATVNQGECKIPQLPVDSPEIMKFYSKADPLNCGNSDDDWVLCYESVCRVKPTVIKRKGFVSCSYTDLIRKSDYKVKYGKTTYTTSEYILNQSDFAKVVCKAANGDRWHGIAIGIRNNVKRSQKEVYHRPQFNVLMIGFDSLSKNAFIRKLPLSYKYLVKQLEADILNGYNIIGDGTPQALIPILTGYTELELPETRKRMKDSQFVNVYPMIWKEYEEYGYLTSFNEDVPDVGTFTYRLNGFNEQPTDHYMRTYYLEVNSYMSTSKKFCIGRQPSHQIMLNYTRDFMRKYVTKPRFVFSFHGELSHDSINLIELADEDLKNWLEDLKKSSILDNTILIVMSDHGNRFAEVRDTLQGKQEERLPFFSFTFPKLFKQMYNVQYHNFRNNVNLLTTPFDVHATLQDILRLQTTTNKPGHQQKYRAISLFDEIPKNRSCADASIEPHWCACLNWTPINDTQNVLIRQVAENVVSKINNFTKPQRNLCEMLYLKEINWAMKIAPQDGLLRFKKNLDYDGFLADLSSNADIKLEMYQVKITVLPGDSIFEASISHDLIRNKLSVKLSDISRINKYGSQANCIYNSYPELRKFCFCRNDRN